jgi:hypothetical protein
MKGRRFEGRMVQTAVHTRAFAVQSTYLPCMGRILRWQKNEGRLFVCLLEGSSGHRSVELQASDLIPKQQDSVLYVILLAAWLAVRTSWNLFGKRMLGSSLPGNREFSWTCGFLTVCSFHSNHLNPRLFLLDPNSTPSSPPNGLMDSSCSFTRSRTALTLSG